MHAIKVRPLAQLPHLRRLCDPFCLCIHPHGECHALVSARKHCACVAKYPREIVRGSLLGELGQSERPAYQRNAPHGQRALGTVRCVGIGAPRPNPTARPSPARHPRTVLRTHHLRQELIEPLQRQGAAVGPAGIAERVFVPGVSAWKQRQQQNLRQSLAPYSIVLVSTIAPALKYSVVPDCPEVLCSTCSTL